MSRLSLFIAACAALTIAGAAALVAALGSADSVSASLVEGTVWFSGGAIVLLIALVCVLRIRMRSRRPARRSTVSTAGAAVEALASIAR